MNINNINKKTQRGEDVTPNKEVFPAKDQVVDPFKRSSALPRSPPPAAIQETPKRDKETKCQTRPEEGTQKSSAEDKTEEAIIISGLTPNISPKRNYIAKMRKDEEEVIRKCKKIITKMKGAVQKQRNIAMDVKTGLQELEEALDVIKYYRSSWKKAEEEVNARVSRKKDTDLRGEKLAEDTPTTGGKRAASSPAETNTGKKKKPTPLETTKETPKEINREGNAPKETAKETPLNPWTVVRPKKVSKKTSLNPGEATKTPSKKDAARTLKPTRKPKPRRDAILIKPAQGTTYAEVLKEIRSKTNPEASQAEVKSIRQTRAGGVLLELGDKTKDKGVFQSSLANILGESATVQRLEPKETLEIRDLDSLTTSEEVIEAIKKMGGELIGKPKVSLTRENSRGLKMAIVELSARGAEELLKSQRIKIGWVNCRVRRRLMIPRCYACFGYGHRQDECKGPQRRQLGVCIRCGEEGHKKSECKAQAKCFLCTEKKIAPNLLGHVPGSGNCFTFRQALEEAKKSKRA